MAAEGFGISEHDFDARFDPVTGSFALRGSADARVTASLDELVQRIHHAPRTAGHLAIDLRRVEFMAASCLNVFAGWVRLIKELPIEQRYELRFSINPMVPWQKRSLQTLSGFAGDLVKLVP